MPSRLSWVSLVVALLFILEGCASADGPTKEGRPWTPKRSAKPQAEFTTWAVKGKIHLKWQSLSVAKSYTLFWSRSPDVATARKNPIKGIRGTSYIHQDLQNGKTYYYYLIALDGRGNERNIYPVVADVPYDYKVRRYRNFLGIVPRIHDTFESLAKQHLKDPGKGWIIKEFNDLPTLVPFRAVLIPRKVFEPGSLTYRGFRTVPILTYHRLSRIKSSRMAVMATDFELQMAYLKRNRYQVISLEDFVRFMEFEGQVPEKSVVLTFDDGWRSTFEIVLPILKRFGFKATLFLYTDLVGTAKRSLSWDQVRKIEKSGVIDVQCHSRSHRNLKMQPGETIQAYFKMVEKELRDSRALIQKKIGKKCQYLAYPYGATNHLVTALAEKLGYRAAFTVRRGSNPFFISNFRVLRSMVYGEYSLKEFAKNLSTYNSKTMR